MMYAWMLRKNWSWAEVALVALAYYAAARLGLLLQLPGTNASPVWPPSGIGLAALMMFGLRVWPGIMLGAFLANLLTLPSTPAGVLASSAICPICAFNDGPPTFTGKQASSTKVNASEPSELSMRTWPSAVGFLPGMAAALNQLHK